MSDTELKQCPFCGGEAKLKESTFYKGRYWVYCKICHTEIELKKSREIAIEAWNRRENQHE